MRDNTFKPYIKLKVALIHNIIAPYRVPLFEELSKNPNIDLFVYFIGISENNRMWVVDSECSFKYKILPKITLNLGKEVFYHINPTIITELYNGKFDVIISADYSSFANQIAFFIAKFLKIPFILWSGSTENEPSFLRTLSLPLIKQIVKHSDAFIAYGTRAKEYLVKLGAPEDKVSISFNTVDTTYFKNECLKLKNNKYSLRKKLGFNHEHIVLYVGQLIERKGVKYLLYAHKKLTEKYDVGLVLVGNGSEKSELLNLSKLNNIDNVYFVDFVQLNNLPQYYSIADVFVLPSLEEVWGLVINEAMACGLPIVTTTKVGASVDLVQKGINGFIVKDGNSKDLQFAIDKILSDQNLKEKMSKVSMDKIQEQFTIKDAVNGLIDSINYVID